MHDIIVTYLPYFLSAITLYSMHLAGHRKRSAWLVALFGQGMWLVWIIITHSFGLLVMNIPLWYVYSRNYFRWQ